MTFDQFIGQVQHRAQLGSEGDALIAIEATLQTLAERLNAGEAKDLAAQLPRALGIYFRVPQHSVRMSLNEFFATVSLREQTHLPASIHHARVVIEVLQEAVSRGEIDDVRAQLPAEWSELFNSGAEGKLRARSASHPKKSVSPVTMKVRDVLTRNCEVIHPEMTICEAARKMKQHDIGMLPVCDGERLVGALTDRDLTIRAIADGHDPLRTKIREVMTHGISYCFEEDSLDQAARIMEEKQIRRLPVLNKEKRLIGIVSVGDLAVRTHDEQLVEEVLECVCEPA